MSNTPLHLWRLQVLGETAPQWLLIWCFLEGYPAATGYDQTAGKGRKKRETFNRQITLIFHYIHIDNKVKVSGYLASI